jgi:hypothetical protein
MAALSTIRVPVESAYVFGRGAMLVGLEAVMSFELRGKVEDAQERDKETGLRLWLATVIDLDQMYQPGEEDAGFRRSAEAKVKIAAAQRPVPPPPQVAGFGPVVEFEGLTLTPWTDDSKCKAPEQGKPHRCRARLAWSLRATGMREFSGLVSTKA